MDVEYWKQLTLLLVTTLLVVSSLLFAKHLKSSTQKVKAATIAISVAAYLSVVWITIVEKAGADKTIEAFGKTPLGIPWFVFVPLMLFILGTPVPYLFRYIVVELFLQSGTVDPASIPKSWKGRDSVAKWIVGYLLLLIAIWISFTAWRGI